MQSLINEVHASRSWGYAPRSFDEAWQRVLQAALTPAGGGWEHSFDPMLHMTPPRLAALARVIDRELYGEAVFMHMAGSGRLGFAAVDWTPGEDDWVGGELCASLMSCFL